MKRERERALPSFFEFAKLAWHQVEPGDALEVTWWFEAICQHLQWVSEGRILKLLINIPPGHAKSKLVSVLWPAWEWARTPSTRMLCASYAQVLIERDALGARTLMESPWYRERFVEGWGSDRFDGRGRQDFFRWDEAQASKGYYANDLTGCRISVTTHSKATGLRARRILVDDPLKVEDAFSEVARNQVLRWWDQTMPTRVSNIATDPVVVIMQRLHEDDLAGHIGANDDPEKSALEKLRDAGWAWLCLPAEFEPERRSTTYDRHGDVIWQDPRTTEGELLWPSRFPLEVLGRDEGEGLKKRLGMGYASQFQQRPIAASGGLFKFAHWRFWRHEGNQDGTTRVPVKLEPERFPRPRKCVTREECPAVVLPKNLAVYVSVDCSFKEAAKVRADGKKGRAPDKVALGVWGSRLADLFLLWASNKRMDFGKTKALAERVSREWPHAQAFLVEDKANGSAILSELRSVVPGLVAIDPAGGKEARAAACQPRQEAGQIYLPDGAEWVGEYVAQLGAFPAGRHDDLVDMTSQLVVYLCNPDLEVLRRLVGG